MCSSSEPTTGRNFLKDSSATSARATAPRPTGRSSARRLPTLTSVEHFALTGPSDPPDPAYHAYRKDLADVALAGRVIASHYAEPVDRLITAAAAPLRERPSEESPVISELS